MKEEEISAEDELKAENELLKLRLELEHGIEMSETGDLNPAAENEFFKNVFEFENAFKNAKRIKLYDFIGQPRFKKADELNGEVMAAELERLEEIMAAHQVALDCICEYPDETIYRFITEELFDYEMEDVRIPGMTSQFIYEEFHPNHDYDLRRHADDFISYLLEDEWSEDICKYEMTDSVVFNGKEYEARGISAIIREFQQAHKSFEIRERKISRVNFNIEKEYAIVKALLNYTAKSSDNVEKAYSGEATFEFKFDFGYWYVSGFSLPGLC